MSGSEGVMVRASVWMTRRNISVWWNIHDATPLCLPRFGRLSAPANLSRIQFTTQSQYFITQIGQCHGGSVRLPFDPQVDSRPSLAAHARQTEGAYAGPAALELFKCRNDA